MWWLTPRLRRPGGALVAVLVGAALAGCGSGDSTAAKTPSGPPPSAASPADAPAVAAPSPASQPDPCAVNLAAPAIAKAVSELPRDPRSHQPWNPEPLAGNYSECAALSAVIIRANTNTENPSTRAVLFHLGQYLAQAVPDTYGFNGIALDRCTNDTVALQHPSGVAGVTGVVRFRWNGTAVEIAGNTRR